MEVIEHGHLLLQRDAHVIFHSVQGTQDQVEDTHRMSGEEVRDKRVRGREREIGKGGDRGKLIDMITQKYFCMRLKYTGKCLKFEHCKVRGRVLVALQNNLTTFRTAVRPHLLKVKGNCKHT